MLKMILSGLIVLFPIFKKDKTSEDSFCSINPIYCQIVKNNPEINKKYAMSISNKIYSIAKKHKINPRRYAAILAQESMYILSAKNCKGGICVDFGISQINKNTAKAYGFDTERLTYDLDYSLNAGAIVLSDIGKKYSGKESDWWTRYNSSNTKKRKQYATLVSRYL